MNLRTNFKQVIYFYLYSLVLLFLMRTILYILNFYTFNNLDLYETLASYFMGLRIDIITINTFCAIFILALLLPFKFAYNSVYRYTIGILWFLVLTIIIFIDITDILYFPFVNRHITGEIIALVDDTHIIVDMIVDTYLFQSISFVVGLTLLFLLWLKILRLEIQYKKYNYKYFFLIFLLIILLVAGIRAKINGKPFNIVDAYTSSKIQSANLALSGFYSFYRNYAKSIEEKYQEYFDNQTAKNNVQKLLKSDKFKFIDDSYPIKRASLKDDNKTKYNVIIVLLESFSSRFVDSFNENIGLGVTSNLDYMANNGIKFTNFYANGQRSIAGITALFTGLISTNSSRFLGRGYESSNLSYLGNIAKDNGYSTLSMQSSKRHSYRVDSISSLAGFDQYYGAEDMKRNQHNEDINKHPRFGTWDGDMFNLYFEKINSLKEPFLTFTFTATTHLPYILPNKKYKKYQEHNKKGTTGMLNTMYYTDDMIGDFMTKARKTAWFKNTIFIFTADHTAGIYNTTQRKNFFNKYGKKIPLRMQERQKIPLIIYAPYIFKKSINKTLSSQVDIMPTIIDILGWQGDFSSMGNSVFDNSVKNRYIIAKTGNTYLMIKDGNITKSNTKINIFQYGEDDLSKYILSIDQILNKLYITNKIY